MTTNPMPASFEEPNKTSRRRWLGAAGVSLGAMLGAPAARAQAPSPEPQSLVPSPSAEEGPFYVEGAPVRRDITEGRDGVPIELVVRIVDRRNQPLQGIALDLWHCDAQGVYSGFDRQGPRRDLDTTGQLFLRGRQLSDVQGQLSFVTLYPGWYEGRTTHLHCKLFNGDRELVTTQLFLPDALSEFIYTQVGTYRRDTLRDVLNATDDVALGAGDDVHSHVRQVAGRYVVTQTLVIDPRASVPAVRVGPPSAGDHGPQDHRGPPHGMPRDHPPLPGAWQGGPPLPPPWDDAAAASGQGGGPPGRHQALVGQARVDALVPHKG